MISHRITEAADRAAHRYDMLAQTFSAIYKTALLSSDFGWAGQFNNVFNEAYGAAHPYLESDNEAMHQFAHEIAQNAHQSALAKIASIDTEELADAAYDHLNETQTYIQSEIAAQVHRDIAQMRFQLQRVVLDVGLLARSRQLKTREAQMAYMISKQDDLQLNFVDRRGRRTPSRTFVRSVWRQAMLSIHNETTLHVLADHGLEEAAVMKFEDGVVKQVGRIRIEEYAEQRDTLFHPNSNAWLEVETDDV